MQIKANGLSFEVERHGNPEHPPVLLIMGLASQMILWPDEFIATLVDRGFHVIRYDNRDIGLSEKLDGVSAPNPLFHIMGKRLLPSRKFAAYDLEDMTADAVGLLDALGIAQTHVLGVSMGGMISQVLAAKHPERMLGVVPVMTSTNSPRLPRARPEVTRALFANSRRSFDDKERAIAEGVRIFKLIGTPNSPMSDADREALIRTSFERSSYRAGAARQLAAIIDSGDLRRFARTIKAPTLVIHGDADPLVPAACGKDVAKSVPGARFEALAGMGHDLPPGYATRLAEMAADHFAAVSAKG